MEITAHSDSQVALAKYSDAISWPEIYCVICAHPELLSVDTENALTARRNEAQAREAHVPARVIDEDIAWLKRCRADGVKATFVEKLDCKLEELEEFAASSFPLIRKIMAESSMAIETDDPNDLDQAAALWEHLFWGRPKIGNKASTLGVHIRESHRPFVLDNAATLFLRRYAARSLDIDLDRAITLATQAIDQLPAGIHALPLAFFTLGEAYYLRFLNAGQWEDLQEAIEHHAHAVEISAEDQPQRNQFLVSLARGLHQRYALIQRAEDLDQAASIYRVAFQEARDTPSRWDILAHGLGKCLLDRYEVAGRFDDLNDVIAYLREALQGLSQDASILPQVLNLLGLGLITRYVRSHRIEDLQTAITTHRHALDVSSPSDPERVVIFTNLGCALRNRYEHVGELNDLEESIALLQQARNTPGLRDAQRRIVLANLSTALSRYHERTGQVEYLMEAIALERYIVEVTSREDPEYAKYLANLGSALFTRFRHTRRIEDLQEAIAAYREALEALATDSPVRPSWLRMLGNFLEQKYEITENIEDLAEANAVNIEAKTLLQKLDAATGFDPDYMSLKQLDCEQCGPVTVTIHLIVNLADIEPQSEVVALLMMDLIHCIFCPVCEKPFGTIGAPLLLQAPSSPVELAYILSPDLNSEENAATAAKLLERWETRTKRGDQDERPTLLILQRDLLRFVMENGVEGVSARLAEIRENGVDPCKIAVTRLFRSETWIDAYETMREYSVLYDEQSEAILVAELNAVRDKGNDEMANQIEAYMELISRSREIGVRVAFEERLPAHVNELDESDAMAKVPAAIQEDAREAERQKNIHKEKHNWDALDIAAACWERIFADSRFDSIPVLAKVALWNKAGLLYGTRYETRENMADLDREITLWRQALEIAPPNAPPRLTILMCLHNALKVWCTRTGDLAFVEEAIAISREALHADSFDSTLRGIYLAMLGDAILMRHEHTGDMADLDEAISIGRQALAFDPTNRISIKALALALQIRHAQTAQVEDLDEIITICGQGRDDGATDHGEILMRLSIALLNRYERFNKLEDLDEAIKTARQDVQSTPRISPHWAPACAQLGSTLCALYRHTGNIANVDEAIAVCRDALKASPQHPLCLDHLATALRTRYQALGRIEDLQEVIALSRRALEASNHRNLNHAILFQNLGNALHDLYQRTELLEDLDEAIAFWRSGVETMSPEALKVSYFLETLGSGLRARYQLTGNAQDLDEALTVHMQAFENRQVETSRTSYEFSQTLHLYYEFTQNIDHLDFAIELLQNVGHAASPRTAVELGRNLRARYEVTANTEDLEQATAVVRGAFEQSRSNAALDTTLSCAQALGFWALERADWQEASAVFGEAIRCVDTLCEEQLLRAGKFHALRSSHVLYAQAAYAMARNGDLTGAVLATETGRARVLTGMLDRNRADVEEIEKLAPELVHRYRATLATLRRLEGDGASDVIQQAPRGPDEARRLSEQIREARAELHAAVAAIRATPGGAAFLAKPSLELLAAALEPEVPLIYLASTSLGGFALIVSIAAGGLSVMPLWLDSLTTEAEREIINNFRNDYWGWLEHPENRIASATWQEQIKVTTRTLWDIAMGPILSQLEEHFPNSKRAVLIPNGLLALLPLHAAWTEDEKGNPRWAMDDVGFTYAPSARALGHARDIVERCRKTRLLAIDDPRPSNAPALPNCQHEIESAHAYFLRENAKLLSGNDCRRVEVLSAVADADICHFACHGANDWHNPLTSGLLMAHDEKLTVEDLLNLPGKNGRMAVLSACETGIVGTNAPNEVVALPAAFLQAGFAGVVASLWSVYDISASLLMAKFYELWLGEQRPPVNALRKSQIWLRDLKNRELVNHLEQLVPELVPRMALETAETLHFSALVQDPDAAPFAHPVHWAAFYLTGV